MLLIRVVLVFWFFASSLALAEQVVRCQDGVFREGSQCPRAVAVPAPSRATACDPAHPGYAECVRTLNAYRAARARQDDADRRQQQAELDRQREGQFWKRLSGNCDFLQNQTERDECKREQRNDRIQERNLREQAEAEREARMRALRR